MWAFTLIWFLKLHENILLSVLYKTQLPRLFKFNPAFKGEEAYFSSSSWHIVAKHYPQVEDSWVSAVPMVRPEGRISSGVEIVFKTKRQHMVNKILDCWFYGDDKQPSHQRSNLIKFNEETVWMSGVYLQLLYIMWKNRTYSRQLHICFYTV